MRNSLPHNLDFERRPGLGTFESNVRKGENAVNQHVLFSHSVF